MAELAAGAAIVTVGAVWSPPLCANTVTETEAPGLLSNATRNVFWEFKLIVQSALCKSAPNEELPKIIFPLIETDAEEARWLPLPSPFCRCKKNGYVSTDG